MWNIGPTITRIMSSTSLDKILGNARYLTAKPVVMTDQQQYNLRTLQFIEFCNFKK